MRVEGVRQSPPVETIKDVSKGPSQDAFRDMVKTAERENVQKEPAKNLKSVEKAVELLNKTMESYNTEIRFTMHKKSGEFMVKIVNTRDNTVIREIPPESVLDMVAYFKEVLGLIVDKFI